jgi:hypothetical protein
VKAGKLYIETACGWVEYKKSRPLELAHYYYGNGRFMSAVKLKERLPKILDLALTRTLE